MVSLKHTGQFSRVFAPVDVQIDSFGESSENMFNNPLPGGKQSLTGDGFVLINDLSCPKNIWHVRFSRFVHELILRGILRRLSPVPDYVLLGKKSTISRR